MPEIITPEEIQRNIEYQARCDRESNQMMVVFWTICAVIAMAVALGGIYGLVRFVKWAWES